MQPDFQLICKSLSEQYFRHHDPKRKLPKCYYIFILDIAKVYIRDNGIYNLEGQVVNTLTLANIEVDSNWSNKGIGSVILDTLIEINPYSVLITECVHNPVLQQMLLRRSFVEDLNLPLNYYLFKES